MKPGLSVMSLEESRHDVVLLVVLLEISHNISSQERCWTSHSPQLPNISKILLLLCRGCKITKSEKIKGYEYFVCEKERERGKQRGASPSTQQRGSSVLNAYSNAPAVIPL